MSKLIFDASQAISWAEELEDTVIFDKLVEAGFEPILPERVAEEVESDNEVAEHILSQSETRRCSDEIFDKISDRHFRLGDGELAVLAIGEELENNGDDYFCVLDDGLARDACEHRELEYTGTIGLVAMLVDEDLIDLDEGNRLIEEMKAGGTHLPDNHKELLRESVSN